MRERIARLERELEKLRSQRESRRKRRARRDVPVLSIVGYTNAGKSTLLTALTRTEVPIARRRCSRRSIRRRGACASPTSAR